MQPYLILSNLEESPIADLNERASHQLAGIESRVVAACTVRGKIGCRRLLVKALLAIAGHVVPLLCWLLFVNTKDSTKTHHAQTKNAPARHAYAHPAGTQQHTRRSRERTGTNGPPPSHQRRSRHLPVSYRSATRFAGQCPAESSPAGTSPYSDRCPPAQPPSAPQNR